MGISEHYLSDEYALCIVTSPSSFINRVHTSACKYVCVCREGEGWTWTGLYCLLTKSLSVVIETQNYVDCSDLNISQRVAVL